MKEVEDCCVEFELGSQHSPSKTRHSINGIEVSKFKKLEFAHYDGEDGYYLLYAPIEGTGTDTWHQNLEDAFHQAQWEFGVQREEWTRAPS